MLFDLRYALRSLARRPLVTAVAVLSLALGIGVNTSIFSVLERLLLRRLPVPAAEEIVLVTSPGPRSGSRSTGDGGGPEAIFSYPHFRDIEAIETGDLRMGAHRDFRANLSYQGRTSEGEGVVVSGRYFSVLGLAPALGRLLGPQDDQITGGHDVVVLAYEYWSTAFGSDPDVIGDRLIVNGSPMTIVGVAPRGFRGNTTLDRPQIFLPLSMAGVAFRGGAAWSGFTDRADHWLYVFARLQPGVSREEAESRLNVPYTALIRDVELPALQAGMRDRDREAFARRRIVLEDGSRERNGDRAEVRQLLGLLFAVTGFVLAIACANVANLLLARAVERGAEISIRLSVGASVPRLVRLLLVECCLLGLLGGVGALAVARLTIGTLMWLLPPEDRPMLAFSINWTVLLFTLALGIGTSLLFGLFPVLHGVRHAAMPGGTMLFTRTSGSGSASRFRVAMATVQVALATALLAVAGLFAASLFNIARVELGIQREGLATFRLSPDLSGYGPERTRALFQDVEDALRAVPGVTAATAATVPILSNSNWENNLTVEGFVGDPGTETTAFFSAISTGYFATLGIPFVSGRDFTLTDIEGAPRVAIINEAFARQFNLGSRAVGTRMALGARGNRPFDIEIVGLVRDAKYSRARDVAPPQFFLPYRQGGAGTLTFYVRGAARAEPLVSTIPGVVRQLDPDLPITNLRTMDEQVWENTTRERVLSTLSAWFAGLATVLAVTGLYAVIAYGVAQRLREIAVRIALGARPRDVRWLVLSQVTRIGAAGGAIGVGLALALGRLCQALLFGVEGSDAAIIAGAAATVLSAAACAGVVPARRAASIHPVTALR